MKLIVQEVDCVFQGTPTCRFEYHRYADGWKENAVIDTFFGPVINDMGISPTFHDEKVFKCEGCPNNYAG